MGPPGRQVGRRARRRPALRNRAVAPPQSARPRRAEPRPARGDRPRACPGTKAGLLGPSGRGSVPPASGPEVPRSTRAATPLRNAWAAPSASSICTTRSTEATDPVLPDTRSMPRRTTRFCSGRGSRLRAAVSIESPSDRTFHGADLVARRVASSRRASSDAARRAARASASTTRPPSCCSSHGRISWRMRFRGIRRSRFVASSQKT